MKMLHLNIELKIIHALAFFPADIVIPTFVDTENELPDAILNYVETVFIGVRARNGRRGEPRFPIQFWNVRESVEAHLPRTNNHLEGWHNSFNQNVYHLSPLKEKWVVPRKIQSPPFKEMKLNTTEDMKKTTYAQKWT